MDCPWFPVEAVMTPRARSSSESCETRLIPPRTLKAPMGCAVSSLRYTSHSSTSDIAAERTSGVGARWLLMTWRARYTSEYGASPRSAPQVTPAPTHRLFLPDGARRWRDSSLGAGSAQGRLQIHLDA